MTECVRTAEEFNKLGSDKLKECQFLDALSMYDSAIGLATEEARYYSNRSLCHHKMENYGLAISDANKAILLNPQFSKAYYRRAVSQMSIGRLKEALSDFKFLVTIHPTNKEVAAKHKFCADAYNRLLFAKAIEVKTKSAFDAINADILASSDPNWEMALPAAVTVEYAQKLLEYMKNQKLLPKNEFYKLLLMARDVLIKKSTLVRYTIPENGLLTVCGDVHGQYYDLIKIFELNGLPSETNNYLFNGDFVDRGSFSVEVITLLLLFSVIFPDHFLLNRGNHETISTNSYYGFAKEITKKYSNQAYEIMCELFQYLPIVHVINGKVMVVHGGLPEKEGVTLEDIEKMNRVKEPEEGSVLFDLLWTDPSDTMGKTPSARGVGSAFGQDITERFCRLNNLDYIIRSHQVKMSGHSEQHGGKCVTVFSAPNYCDEVKNMGAYIQLKQDLVPVYREFRESYHPKVESFLPSSFMP